MAAAGFEQATSADLERSGSIQTRVGFDVIEILPERAHDRLRALRLKSREAHAVIPGFNDRAEVNGERGDAERRLQQLLAPRSQNGFQLDPTDARVVEQEKLVQKCSDEARRLSELYEVRSEQWRSASRVVQAVEDWLKNGRPQGTVLQDYDGPEPKPLKGEDILSAIERYRRNGREGKATLHRLRSAPYPSSHVRAKIRQEVQALAVRGTPSVGDAIEHDRSVVWPMQQLQGSIINAQTPSFAVTEVPDVLGLFAAVHETALLAFLDSLVSEESDDASTLSHSDRAAREAEALSDLLACERDESWCVWRAMDDNLPVQHRVDCDPCAILQCNRSRLRRPTDVERHYSM